MGCVVKVKEKYFKTNYRFVYIVLNVNTMIDFKLNLQFTFRNNKNCFSIIVNFHVLNSTLI